ELRTTIAPGAMYAAADAEDPTDPAGVAELARDIGASVVIYATIERFTLSTDGTSFNPTSTLFVRVIDVEAMERVWPDREIEATERGYPLVASSFQQQGFAPGDPTARRQAEEDLARLTGLRLSQVFYEHLPEQASDTRNVR
ncbi:MAG: hypothetical protein AAF747_05770, partial [Planctomycetota bacterium]